MFFQKYGKQRADFMKKRKIYELSKEDPENSFKISLLNASVRGKTKNMHQHDHYEILHCTLDEYYIHIDNYKYFANSNSIVLFPPHLKHRVIRKNIKTVRTLINFKHDFAKPIADLLDINLDRLFSDSVLVFSDQQTAKLNSLAEKMMSENRKNILPSQNAHLKLLFAQYLFILTQTTQKNKTGTHRGIESKSCH